MKLFFTDINTYVDSFIIGNKESIRHEREADNHIFLNNTKLLA